MVTKYDHEHIIFQAVYIQTISMPSGVFKPYAFTFQSGYIQMGNVYKCIVCKNLYIPIWLYSNDYAMRYDLVLDVLYIPIWLYSNPSPIIPSIQDILNPIFCLPGYSQVQNYYGGCILLLLNIHLPLFYNICRTLYIL